MARSKSLFNDRAQEIDELTKVIKKDMKTLTDEVRVLQDYVAQNRSGVHQMDRHSDTVINDLNKRIQQQTKTFAEALKTRQEVTAW